MERLYTTSALVKIAKQNGIIVTRERIRQLCEAGVIRASKPGRDWLIEASEAERWLKERQDREE